MARYWRNPLTISGEQRLPPGQQMAAADKWPIVGERASEASIAPWRLAVIGEVEQPLDLSLEQLDALPRTEATVDIHCVTRWSKLGMRFSGVALGAVLRLARPKSSARFISFVAQTQRQHSTSLVLADAVALHTLLALRCEGAPLVPHHGGPLRSIVPQRYFYKSLKWLRTIELLREDRLGYWEAVAGYHNTADPWRQQRFIAPSLSKHEAAAILAGRDLSGREFRGLDAAGRILARLNATSAILRDVNFSGCELSDAIFDKANLSNARFVRATLCRASFAGADLEGVDFAGADLRGADLRGASLLGASFVDARTGDGALIDTTTRFDASSARDLMPQQQEFLRQAGIDPRI